MSKKSSRRTVKPVYVPEDFNEETKNEIPEALIDTIPPPMEEKRKGMSPRESAEKPRSYSPRNMIVGMNTVEEARSKEELLRTAGFQLNHALASRNSNYFHVTSKKGREAYIKTPLDENVFDQKEFSPRTRGFLVPAKKTASVHLSLEEREKLLNSCKQHCYGVAVRNQDKSSITFVDSSGYDTHFFAVDTDIPLPIVHVDEIAQNSELIHETIDLAASALEKQAMKFAEEKIDSFLEQFAELRKSVSSFSRECDEIISAYDLTEEDSMELVAKFLKMARKIEATRGVFLELQQIIEESTQ